jgi:hypothetical protein
LEFLLPLAANHMPTVAVQGEGLRRRLPRAVTQPVEELSRRFGKGWVPHLLHDSGI